MVHGFIPCRHATRIVEDRREEQEKLEEHGQDVLSVAKRHIESRGEVGQAQRQKELERDRDGQHEHRRRHGSAVRNGEEQQDGKRQQEVEKVGRYGDGWKNRGWESGLLDQLGVVHDRAGRHDERGLKPVPCEQAREKKAGVVRDIDGQYRLEDEVEDNQLKQRIEQ
jgi:hypothetical protein